MKGGPYSTLLSSTVCLFKPHILSSFQYHSCHKVIKSIKPLFNCSHQKRSKRSSYVLLRC